MKKITSDTIFNIIVAFALLSYIVLNAWFWGWSSFIYHQEVRISSIIAIFAHCFLLPFAFWQIVRIEENKPKTLLGVLFSKRVKKEPYKPNLI